MKLKDAITVHEVLEAIEDEVAEAKKHALTSGDQMVELRLRRENVERFCEVLREEL